jgi:hypothetical protein
MKQTPRKAFLRCETLANTAYPETQLLELRAIDDISPLEDPPGLLHKGRNLLPVHSLAILHASLLGQAVSAVSRALCLGCETVEGILLCLVTVAGNEVLELEDVHLGELVLEEPVDVLRGCCDLGPSCDLGLDCSGHRGVAELVPLCQNADGARAVDSLPPVVADLDALHLGLAETHLANFLLDAGNGAAGVEDGDLGGHLGGELSNQVHCDTVAGVVCVLLESEAEKSNLLSPQRAVEGTNNLPSEALPLVVVDIQHTHPVVSDLGQVQRACHVRQVQDILLEAGAAKSYTCVQEATSKPGVRSQTEAQLLDIGAELLAQSRHGIDAGDALGKHSVGHQLCELGRPCVDRQDAGGGDPRRVNALQCVGGLDAFGCGGAADEDAIGVHEVLDGTALREELGVVQDLERVVGTVEVELRKADQSYATMGGRSERGGRERVTYNVSDHVCGTARNSALLDNDGSLLCVLCDHASGTLEDAEIRRGSCAEAVQLCGGVDADEDNVSLGDRLSHFGRESKVGCPLGNADSAQTGQIDQCGVGTITGNSDDLGETILVDGKVGRAPCRTLLLAQVDYVDNDLGVVVCDESSSGSTWRIDQ